MNLLYGALIFVLFVHSCATDREIAILKAKALTVDAIPDNLNSRFEQLETRVFELNERCRQ